MTMRLLRYNAAESGESKIRRIRCHHGKLNGIYIRRGMRCYRLFWRLCK